MSQAGSATRVTLYKTELCRNFELSGSCPFGHRCQFAHGTHELRRRALNPRYKTEKCRNFWATGEATHLLRHGDAPVQWLRACMGCVQRNPHGVASPHVCAASALSAAGHCPYGNKCQFLHTDYPGDGSTDYGSVSGACMRACALLSR